MRLIRCALALVTLAQTTIQIARAQPAGDPMVTVIEAYQQARAAGDVDAMVAQFADGAVVSVQGRQTQTFSGRNQVRVYAQTLAVQYRAITRTVPHVDGMLVSWTEHAQIWQSQQTVDAHVQAIVSSGRIISMLYSTAEPSNGSIQAGSASAGSAAAKADRPRELPSATWPAVLAGIGFVLLGLAFGLPRRRTTGSQLDGRLLRSLQRPRIVGDEKQKAA
jgi:hypothetical protein